MSDEMVKTHLSTEAMDLLRWCEYVGPHPHEEGWLMIFRFENGLQATVAYGPHSNGLSVGVMDGDALVEVTDWLEGWEVIQTLIEIMRREVVKKQEGSEEQIGKDGRDE